MGGMPQPPPKSGGGKVALIAIPIVLLVCVGGGVAYYMHDKADRRDRLASLCIDTRDQLKHPSGDSDTFILQLSNVLESCSGACDRDDSASCKSLDEEMGKLCSVDNDMCKKFCDTLTSPSGKKAACDHKNDKPKDDDSKSKSKSDDDSKPKSKSDSGSSTKSDSGGVATTDDTGVKECDQYLAVLDRCKGAMGDSMHKTAAELRKTFKQLGKGNMGAMRDSCKSGYDATKDVCP
jgi:hypothetical protein